MMPVWSWMGPWLEAVVSEVWTDRQYPVNDDGLSKILMSKTTRLKSCLQCFRLGKGRWSIRQHTSAIFISGNNLAFNHPPCRAFALIQDLKRFPIRPWEDES